MAESGSGNVDYQSLEDDEMLSGGEDSDCPSDPTEDRNEGTQDPVEAILACILESMCLDSIKKGPSIPVARLTEEEKEEKAKYFGNCEELLATWKSDVLFSSPLLRDATTVRAASDQLQWVTVGALCWVKHQLFDWWPGIIKRVRKAKGAKSITQQAEASVMFLEPNYQFFLHYAKHSPSFKIQSRILPFVSMCPLPEGTVRPQDQTDRSHRSWLTCTRYPDYTYYEISERMTVLCERFQNQLIVRESQGPAKLDLDLLAGLYWLANSVWLKMNGTGVDLPTQPAGSSKWRELLPQLEDVSYWRRDAEEIEESDKRRKNPQDPDDFLDQEETDGCFGFQFIQISLHRDPSQLTYSQESQKIIEKREKYGQQLLDVIRSPECRTYLKDLRDKPRTKRSEALKKNQFWIFFSQTVKSPSGPIVVDSQVFSLYRLMRCLRLRKDVDNVKFLRACYDVWLPEALIYAIQKIKNVSYEEAEKEYESVPVFVPEEIEAKWNEGPTLSMVDVLHQSARQ